MTTAMLVQNSAGAAWTNVLQNIKDGVRNFQIDDDGNTITTGAYRGRNVRLTGSVYTPGFAANADAANGSIDIGRLSNPAATPYISFNGLGAASNCALRNSALHRIDFFCGQRNTGLTLTPAGAIFNGHIATATTAVATLSVCGADARLSGSDTAGTIAIGAGHVTACTLTFGIAFAASPTCVANAYAAGPVVIAPSSVSTAAVTFATAGSVAGGKIFYHCIQ
jgi:hypothetical protein